MQSRRRTKRRNEIASNGYPRSAVVAVRARVPHVIAQRHNGLVVATSWRALRRMAHVRQGSDLDKRIQMVEQKTVEEASQEKRHPYGLIAFRVPTEKGMHWMLSCDSSHQMQQPLNVRLIFVLDKSARL